MSWTDSPDRRLGFFVVLFLLVLFSPPASAQTDLVARVRGLNNELLRLHGEIRQNRPDQVQAHRSQAAQVIAQRAAALLALIQRDPAQALSLTLSRDVLADLAAAFPDSASGLESSGTWRGPIERWVSESADLKSSKTFTRLKTGDQTIDLHFVGHEPPVLTSGSTLRATGVRIGDSVAVTNSTVPSPADNTSSRVTKMAALTGSFSSTTTSSMSTAPMCSTTGVQNTAVLLTTFPGVTPPSTVTPTGVYDVFFGTSGRSLDRFWREASYGKTWAAGNVFGWYALGSSYTCADLTQLRDAAIAAASADGVTFQNYTRIFVVPPYNLDCGWDGLATIGCTTLSSPAGSFTASTTYLVPGDLTSSVNGVPLTAHEGGHNLGLNHAGERDFGAEALGPLGAMGTLYDSGDQFSTMGGWVVGQYSAPHKAALDWIDPGTNYQVVQSSGTWSLQPLETSPAGLQALKIQRGTGNNAWLWVEYRQPIGDYDSALPYTQPFSGALIHYEDSITNATGPRTNLLDFTPETDSWLDPALLAGKTWTDPYSNVSIAVQSATANALTVNVTYGAMPCSHANPTVSASPLNLSTSAGKSVGYNIVVTNNDSAGCSADNFSLASNQPSGWPTSFSTTYLTLNPGQSGTVTMTKNVPPSALAGVYVVDTSAADGTNMALGLANVTVTAPPAVTVGVSTLSLIYTVRQTVSATAMVRYGSSPAAGAAVKFTIREPGGATSAKSVNADSTGKAAWSYKIGGKGPLGTYSVTASATYNSQTSESTASFLVQ